MKQPAAALLLCFLAFAAAHSQPARLGSLEPVEFSALSDSTVSALGHKALAIRAADWKHSETENFVYHYFSSFIATPVSVESEFYYRVIAKDLRKDTSNWERKCHIFVFEKREDWSQFQGSAALDPWTGGIHAANELYLLRDAELKWKGDTLGHEIAHLVVHRFFPSGVPLWLNEGYAEEIATRAYASYHRARGYAAKPRARAVAPDHFIPLAELTAAVSYPADRERISVFYNQSQRLVRFLMAQGQSEFLALLDALANGSHLETALNRAFGARFPGLGALEQEFETYASKDHGTTF